MMVLDPKETSSPVSRGETQNGGGISHAEFALFNSKRLQSDLEAMGNKIKQHEDNLKFLKSQKNKLDESIVDLQGSRFNKRYRGLRFSCELLCILFICFAVLMSKLHSSATPRNENHDTNIQGEDINEQILRHEKSAAGVLCLVEARHGAQASQLTLTKGVVGIVAKLGKVNDEKLSQLVPFSHCLFFRLP